LAANLHRKGVGQALAGKRGFESAGLQSYSIHAKGNVLVDDIQLARIASERGLMREAQADFTNELRERDLGKCALGRRTCGRRRSRKTSGKLRENQSSRLSLRTTFKQLGQSRRTSHFRNLKIMCIA